MTTQRLMTSTFGDAPASEWSISRNEPASLWGGLQDIRGLVAVWRERRWYRRELRRLTSEGSHLIDDVGLTPREVQAEIAKPFWQA